MLVVIVIQGRQKKEYLKNMSNNEKNKVAARRKLEVFVNFHNKSIT